MKTLIAVESPHKAKLISGFLGKDYIILPTVGHFLEMPKPKSMTDAQKKKYGKFSLDLNNNFEPLWKVAYGKGKILQSFKDALKKVDEFVIGTDSDDQGALIGLLLLEELKPKIPTYRATWNEITKTAVENGLKNKKLVNISKKEPKEFFNNAETALTQSSWDRLFGFSVSPYLWKVISPGLSGGRVQTPAARLVVERELKRLAHKSVPYYTITGDFDGITGTLFEFGDKKIATSAQIDDDGNIKDGYTLITDENVDKIVEFLQKQNYEVSDVNSKPYTRKPPAPFTTSTALQSIGSKLRMSTKAITAILQTLYATDGVITYIRTVSVVSSPEAIKAARKTLEKEYGKKYVPAKPNIYKDKKEDNSGHECLRNIVDEKTGLMLEAKLKDPKNQKVFNIISKRMLASQSIPCTGTTWSAVFSSMGTKEKATAKFKASETEIEELGWTKIYKPDDDEKVERNSKIKSLTKGSTVTVKNISKEAHKTVPPARLTEVKLISELSDRNIGRPATFSSMVNVIQERLYVQKLKGGYLAPTFRGFAMMNIMLKHFPKYLDYDYTAKMEKELDSITDGKETRQNFLSNFWFGKNNDGFDEFVKNLNKNINWDEIKELSTIDLHNGYSIVYNKFGSFLQDNNGKVNEKGYLPSVKIEDDGLIEDYLDAEKCKELMETAQNTPGPRVLGVLNSGEYKDWEVSVKSGKYGDYVQATAPESKGKVKPINHTLPEGLTIEEVELKDVAPLFAEVKLPRWSNDGKYLVGINKKGGQYAGFKPTPKAKRLQFKELPEEYNPRTVDFEIVKELFEKEK